MLDSTSLKPIYIQLMEWTEDQILKGRLLVGDRIMSQNEFAAFFNINAITASRGITLLEQKGIVEKRRGIGMFVKEKAKQIILDYRNNDTLIEIIKDLLLESKKLGYDREKLIEKILSVSNDLESEQ